MGTLAQIEYDEALEAREATLRLNDLMGGFVGDLELGAEELRRQLSEVPIVPDTYERRLVLRDEIDALEKRARNARVDELFKTPHIAPANLLELVKQRSAVDLDQLTQHEIVDRKQEIDRQIDDVRAQHLEALRADRDGWMREQIVELEIRRQVEPLDSSQLRDIDDWLAALRREVDVVGHVDERVTPDRAQDVPITQAELDLERDEAAADFESAFVAWRADLAIFGEETRELLDLNESARSARVAAGGRDLPTRDTRFARLVAIALADAGLHRNDLQAPIYAVERSQLLEAYPLTAPRARHCKVCDLDEDRRAAFDAAVTEGLSLRAIQDRFDISRSTISRHLQETK